MPKPRTGRPDPKTGKVRFSISLNKALYARVDRKATEEDVPVRFLVERMIDLYVDEIEVIVKKKENVPAGRRRVAGGDG